MRLVTDKPSTVSPRCSYLGGHKISDDMAYRYGDAGKYNMEGHTLLVIGTGIVRVIFENVSGSRKIATMSEHLLPYGR